MRGIHPFGAVSQAAFGLGDQGAGDQVGPGIRQQQAVVVELGSADDDELRHLGRALGDDRIAEEGRRLVHQVVAGAHQGDRARDLGEPAEVGVDELIASVRDDRGLGDDGAELGRLAGQVGVDVRLDVRVPHVAERRVLLPERAVGVARFEGHAQAREGGAEDRRDRRVRVGEQGLGNGERESAVGEHEPLDAIRVRHRELHGDVAAHRLAEHDRPRDAEVIEQRHDIGGVRRHPERSGQPRASPATAQVGGDDAVAAGEPVGERLQRDRGCRDPMDRDDDLVAGAPAERVQVAAVDRNLQIRRRDKRGHGF